MKIKSEFDLIKVLTKKPKGRNVLVGIGDDAAVLKMQKGKLTVFTTDMLVEDDHFSLKWSKPEQIGGKAIEVNVSDVAAMGAKPRFATVAICITKKTNLKFLKRLYKGIYSAAKRHNVEVVGGDVTHGKELNISVSMIGEVSRKNLVLRSGAKKGDYILVSGKLGASTAGLELLRKRVPGFRNVKKKHLEPKAQLKKALKIGKFANAMEDVSDGLGAEVRNICRESKVGAVIYWEKIPVEKETELAAKRVEKDARGFALFGGEDFELVFTCSKKNLKKMKGTVVGKIIKEKEIFIEKNGKKNLLKGSGYDHTIFL